MYTYQAWQNLFPMAEAKKWPRVAVVGAGAVGGYFGGMLARAGAPVIFIGRPKLDRKSVV